MPELTKEFAEDFARKWIGVWNAGDLEQIFALYEDDFTMTSPYIQERMGISSGVLRGKDSVRPYWDRSLRLELPLTFELEAVYTGVSSVVIQYHSLGRKRVCETFTFGRAGLVSTGCSQHEAVS